MAHSAACRINGLVMLSNDTRFSVTERFIVIHAKTNTIRSVLCALSVTIAAIILILVTPRLYQFQIADKESRKVFFVFDDSYSRWHEPPTDTASHARKMLLIHQAGSVKVGEIVR